MFERNLKKHFWFFRFFCGIVKLNCELWHKLFINIRLRQILDLRPSTSLLKYVLHKPSQLMCFHTSAPYVPCAPLCLNGLRAFTIKVPYLSTLSTSLVQLFLSFCVPYNKRGLRGGVGGGGRRGRVGTRIILEKLIAGWG